MGLFEVISETLSNFYQELLSKSESFPIFSSLIQIALLVLLITFIAIAIFSFYKTLGKKDIIKLNLNEYNRSEHPVLRKFLAVSLYLAEYIVIIPIFILLWSLALSIALLLLADANIRYLVLLTAALIASIRILAYYNSEISKDLAKLFPFITLSVFLINTTSFDFNRLITQIAEIPRLLNQVYIYILFILVVEIVLRLIDTYTKFLKSEDARFV